MTYEELLNLKKPGKPNRYISLIGAGLFILGVIICIFGEGAVAIVAGLGIIGFGLSPLADHYFLTGMFGDNEVRSQMQEIIQDYKVLNDKKPIEANIATESRNLYIKDNLLILNKKQELLYQYDLKNNKVIEDSINSDESIAILSFMHNALFKIIETNYK